MANNEYLIQDTTIQEIVDKVKLKTGTTGGIAGSEIANKIDSILTPTDGTIPTKTSSDLTASGKTITVPAGYYASNASKSVSTATQATPSITVDSNGLITASATQNSGYVSAGTKSATVQLTTKAATTITPGTSDQTAVASGAYTTGNIVVAGDSNLKATNIKKGVNIFGVTGTYESSGLDGLLTQSLSSVTGFVRSVNSSTIETDFTLTFNNSISQLYYIVGYLYTTSSGPYQIFLSYANGQTFGAYAAYAMNGHIAATTSGDTMVSRNTIKISFNITTNNEDRLNTFYNIANSPNGSITIYYK